MTKTTPVELEPLKPEDAELIAWLRNEGRARNRHKGPNAERHKCEIAAARIEALTRTLPQSK